MFDQLRQHISHAILRYLSKPTIRYAPFFSVAPEVFRRALQPGDIVLVEGNTRLSAVIKFLTQSTWSHAALFVGEQGGANPAGEPNVLLEADAENGVTTVPLSKYFAFNKRICRPIGLGAEGRQKVIDYAMARRGRLYDSKQIVDLARYLFPYPPVPVWFRRRMLAIGSGDPTKAICSTLIGEAFASIHYPILPEARAAGGKSFDVASFVQSEVEHIRRHGLYTPRDFDVSPFFAIIKPMPGDHFDYESFAWGGPGTAAETPAAEANQPRTGEGNVTLR